MDQLDLTNHFLIAMPSMVDPCFSSSIVYICQHDGHGALGLIVNKPIDMDIDDRLPVYLLFSWSRTWLGGIRQYWKNIQPANWECVVIYLIMLCVVLLALPRAGCNRCRFAVELESLGVLCLLPAKATQVDNKEMLLYIFLYEKIRAFSGGEILEPKTNSRCWRDLFSSRKLLARNSPATCCSVWRSSFPPQKSEDVAVGGGGDSRDRLVLASNFFPDTKITL